MPFVDEGDVTAQQLGAIGTTLDLPRRSHLCHHAQYTHERLYTSHIIPEE